MGLLRLSQFSSTPNFFSRIRLRQRQRELIKTKIPLSKFEFIVDMGLRVIRVGGATNATFTLYTVPEDKEFYVIALQLYWKGLAANVPETVQLDVGGDTAIEMSSTDLDNDHDAIVMSFPVPIKMAVGETVQVISDGVNITAIANVVGYEIDEKLINSRI